MKVLDNRKTKILFITCITSTIICVILSYIVIKIENTKIINDTNNLLINAIYSLKEQYPNINDGDIIGSLNKQNFNYEDTELISKKYGLDDNTALLNLQKEYIIKLTVILIVVIILSNLLIISIMYIYLKNRKKKITQLITYIDNIKNKNYLLDVEDNFEDELNSLKNELYKLTVMLKERTDASDIQKEQVYKLVSDISHQLKTPLTSCQILLDNLNENKNMDTEIRQQFILEVTRKIEQMNWLIKSLLKLSRLDAKVVEFKSENVNIGNLLSEVVDDLEILSEVKNISININCENSISIYGDYNWNKEAILNIVKNGIEHARKKVEINVEENKVYVKVEIIDDGYGISDKDIKHIFDRFYKSDNSDENSIGIGLALSKSIIEKQNGYISVDSKKDIGTKFTIKYMK